MKYRCRRLSGGITGAVVGSVVEARCRGKNVAVVYEGFWNMGLRVGRPVGTLGFSRPEDKYAKI